MDDFNNIDLSAEDAALIRMRTGPSIFDKKMSAVSAAGKWNQQEAIGLCILVEAICPAFGCHVALTGGLLYKQGPRKDCDILFYRIRQVEQIDMEGLFAALTAAGFEDIHGLGWCWKARYQGKGLDLFFPEQASGEYTAEELAEAAECRAEVRAWKADKAADRDFDDDIDF